MAIHYILSEQGMEQIDVERLRSCVYKTKNANMTCAICKKKNKKKRCTRNKCIICTLPTCAAHSDKAFICINCDFTKGPLEIPNENESNENETLLEL